MGSKLAIVVDENVEKGDSVYKMHDTFGMV